MSSRYGFRCVFVAMALSGAVLRGEGLSDRQARAAPRLRIAASPYPNPLLDFLPTGFDLERHRYRARISTLGFQPSDERGRGHFYTRRGGFLDLAHIRRSIDFAAYVHYQVRRGLREGRERFSFESIDRTTYRGHFTYPPFWKDLPSAEREALIEELALLAAAEASFDFSNWREILTWYDFHNLPGIPERGSAFSFDDVPSHAVGVAVALRALRQEGTPFDEAVTAELRHEVDRLGPVSEEVCRRAMEQVAQRWWGKKTCLKRHLDLGLDDGWIEPWVVRGLEGAEPAAPARYPAPQRGGGWILGRDCRGVVTFECEPHLRRAEILRHVLPRGGKCVRPARDYPALLARIEAEVLREFGPDATRPYP